MLNFPAVVSGCVGSSLAAPWRLNMNDGSVRAATAAELTAAQAAYDAAQAALAAAAVDKAELKAQFQSAVTRLDQIINAAAPNNTQLIAAVQDMATIQKRTLRALYGITL